MKEIERRIFVSKEIFDNEYSYVYGENKDKIVTFQYYNSTKDKEGKKVEHWTYTDAIEFARYWRNDGRYKNYEFLIY